MAIRSVPQPPFSEELLADLHAGNMDQELRDCLWPVAHEDSEAKRYLHALDDVTVHIRALGDPGVNLHPMPADVTARMDQFLEELDLPAHSDADIDALPLFTGATNGYVHEAAPSTNGSGRLAPVVELRARRVTRMRLLAAAAAIIAVVAGVGIATRVLGGDEPSGPTAQPTPTPTEDRIGDDLTATAALAALGRNDVTGPLGSRTALTQCVQAAGLERVILGSSDMRYQGKDAVLILLSGPAAVLPVTPSTTAKPVKITALVVGPGCTTGDPQVRNITDIG